MEDTMVRRGRGRPKIEGTIIHHVMIPNSQAEELRRISLATDRTQASLIREGVAMLLEKWSNKNL